VAAYYTAGLKGRWMETRRKDDHQLHDLTMDVPIIEDGAMATRTVPMLTALNLDLRNEYVADCQTGVKRWNKILADAGIEHTFRLPHPGFNREVGINSGHHVTPDGTIVDEATWEAGKRKWLPTTEDLTFVRSLMHPVYERGKIASWVAPPRQGINGKPFDYEYVYLT
jgi:benzoyl-CoA 2,3-dioxygenase component B